MRAAQSNRIRTYSFAFLSYLILTLIMTYPLALKFKTHVPGGGSDDQIFLWNLWWLKLSLLDLGTDPFYTNHLVYPYTMGLSLHQFELLNGIVSLPLQYFLSLIVINNIFIVLSFAVSGFGIFVLINRMLGDWRAAFLGGVIFAFCPYKWAHVAGHMNLTMTLWMPLYIYFMFRAFDEEKKGMPSAWLAGVMLGFNFLSDYYYFLFMVIFTAIYLPFKRANIRRALGCSALKLLIIGGVSLAFAAPTLLHVAKDSMEGRLRSALPGGETHYVVDLLGFFSPSPHSTLFGRLSFSGLFTGPIGENTAFIGFSVLMLVIIYLSIARREKNPMLLFWCLQIVLFAFLSLGPELYVLGKPTGIPMPFRGLQHIQMFEHFRAPGRFAIGMMLGIAVLSSYGISYMNKKWRYAWLAFAFLVFAEYSAMPIEVFKTSVHPVYEEIRKDAEAEAVLEVPFFLRDGYNHIGTSMETVLFSQTVHEKKMFGGTIGRIGPEHIFLSLLNMPVIRNLALLSMGLRITPAYIETDRRLGSDTADLLGIDYVIVHKNAATPVDHDFVRHVLPLRQIYEDEGLAVYKTIRKSQSAVDIDIGSESSIPYLFRGWINGQTSGAISYAWSTGGKSILFLNLRPGKDYSMSARLMPHNYLKKRRMAIEVNGRPLTVLELKQEWTDYDIVIPSGLVKKGLNQIAFVFEEAVRTNEDFGDVWTKGAAVEYLRQMYLPNQKEDEIVLLDWEQDNRKFRGAPVSAAFDRVSIKAADYLLIKPHIQ